jgi:hypothetical protein
MPEPLVVLQFYGEGVTDVGPQTTKPVLASRGIVPILVYALCGSKPQLRARSAHYAHLHGKKKLWQKVKFAKRQSFYDKDVAGIVFVMDSEGIPEVINELAQGRDAEHADFPMAVGMAHPCIEAWLLCDAKAIQQAMSLPAMPHLGTNPETLPAPQQNRGVNPKTELKRIASVESAPQKEAITARIKDFSVVRAACPKGFAPFADEIEQRIKPLFE